MKLSDLLPIGLWLSVAAVPQAERLAGLLAASKPTGEALAFENEYVRVRHQVLEYPAAERALAEARPVVLYVRLKSESNPESTTLLDAPRGGRLSWRSGAVPRGVLVEILNVPSSSSSLRNPEADPPAGFSIEAEWTGGRLLVATFEPMRFGDGTGPSPSVTVFLSDGVVDVSSDGVRRRIGVKAGDAFWFEARTSVRVVSDHPVGTAIVQIDPGGPGRAPAARPH
jgi:hypothetical protein